MRALEHQGRQKLAKGGVAIKRIIEDVQRSKEFLHKVQKNWAHHNFGLIYICVYMKYQEPCLPHLRGGGA